MTKNRIVAALMSLSLVVTGASAAFAQTDTVPADQQSDAPAVDRQTDQVTDRHRDIDAIKARALQAIDNRLQRVDRLEEAVENHKDHLIGNHYGQLNSKLATTEAGLEQLARKIEDATTLEELRELIPQIWEDFRVYVLLTPQVKLVIASDVAVHVGEKAGEISVRLAEAIQKAEDAGYDVGEAWELLGEFDEMVASAVAQAAPVADAVLPLTPEDWNNGTAQPVLEEARQDIREAHESFKTARQTAKEIVEFLKGLRDTVSDS